MRNNLVMLVVDDLEINRISMCLIFEKEYEVVMAANGREALEILNQRRVDIVILDVYMPELDGTAVLAQMKADRRLREIPVIVKSGVDEKMALAMLEMGADDFILSPSEPAIIRKRVHNVLKNYMYAKAMLQKKFQEQLYCRRMTDRLMADGLNEDVWEQSRSEADCRIRNCTKADASKCGKSMMNLRVILVDDNELLRQYHITFLTRLGVGCDTAVNSADALQILREAHRNGECYDVCFVSWKMHNAKTFIREIRAMFPSERMRIATSTSEKDKLEEEMRSVGVDHVLERPLQQEKIYQFLSNICKEKGKAE